MRGEGGLNGAYRHVYMPGSSSMNEDTRTAAAAKLVSSPG